MIKHVVKLEVIGISAKQLFDFMINPNDSSYSQWWPGTHYKFHIKKHGSMSHLNDEVYFDEYIGRRRLRFTGIVISADSSQCIIWQVKRFGLKLPGWLELRMVDTAQGVNITHTLRIGFKGHIGVLTNPFVKLYANRRFLSDLEAHCLEEWPKLSKMLAP